MSNMKYALIAVLVVAIAITAIAYITYHGTPANQSTETETLETQSTSPTSTYELSPDEKDALLYMIEEEKLARDVYTYFADKYGEPIFSNIAQSEQSHMDAVMGLIEKYGLSVALGDYGKFKNQHIQELYNALIEQGNQSLVEALKVGATIEEVDIVDLKNWLQKVDNPDIVQVFESLMKGSRNHLRSFTAVLKDRFGIEYQPQYLSPEEYQEIISSPMETGNQG